MGVLSLIFGNNSKKIQKFKEKNAVIIDVRSLEEYDSGAIPGSTHIPIQELKYKISDVKKLDKPVITCCESGVRSASAAAILRSYKIEAVNGGGWVNLSKKL